MAVTETENFHYPTKVPEDSLGVISARVQLKSPLQTVIDVKTVGYQV